MREAPLWTHERSLFGLILLSGLGAVLVSLAVAIIAIRRGNVRRHRNFMIGTLLGLAGAGAGALMPGRFLSQLLF